MEKMTIRQWRRVKDLTQKEFAELIGMNPLTYQAKELGKRKFTAAEIKLIARTLNISTETQLDWQSLFFRAQRLLRIDKQEENMKEQYKELLKLKAEQYGNEDDPNYSAENDWMMSHVYKLFNAIESNLDLKEVEDIITSLMY